MLLAQDSRPLIQFTLAPLFDDIGIPLALMGVFVVFVALVLIAAFIKVLPRIFPHPSVSAAEPAGVQPPFAEDEIPEETLVVIAAAVAETIRQPHRIVRIRGLTAEDMDWSREGRVQHHQSHRIQARDPR
jgi:Na+-transporting methylmalonyl-CoA/oxaloacetate decarboxylase gamma subunit